MGLAPLRLKQRQVQHLESAKSSSRRGEMLLMSMGRRNSVDFPSRCCGFGTSRSYFAALFLAVYSTTTSNLSVVFAETRNTNTFTSVAPALLPPPTVIRPAGADEKLPEDGGTSAAFDKRNTGIKARTTFSTTSRSETTTVTSGNKKTTTTSKSHSTTVAWLRNWFGSWVGYFKTVWRKWNKSHSSCLGGGQKNGSSTSTKPKNLAGKTGTTRTSGGAGPAPPSLAKKGANCSCPNIVTGTAQPRKPTRPGIQPAAIATAKRSAGGARGPRKAGANMGQHDARGPNKVGTHDARGDSTARGKSIPKADTGVYFDPPLCDLGPPSKEVIEGLLRPRWNNRAATNSSGDSAPASVDVPFPFGILSPADDDLHTTSARTTWAGPCARPRNRKFTKARLERVKTRPPSPGHVYNCAEDDEDTPSTAVPSSELEQQSGCEMEELSMTFSTLLENAILSRGRVDPQEAGSLQQGRTSSANYSHSARGEIQQRTNSSSTCDICAPTSTQVAVQEKECTPYSGMINRTTCSMPVLPPQTAKENFPAAVARPAVKAKAKASNLFSSKAKAGFATTTTTRPRSYSAPVGGAGGGGPPRERMMRRRINLNTSTTTSKPRGRGRLQLPSAVVAARGTTNNVYSGCSRPSTRGRRSSPSRPRGGRNGNRKSSSFDVRPDNNIIPVRKKVRGQTHLRGNEKYFLFQLQRVKKKQDLMFYAEKNKYEHSVSAWNRPATRIFLPETPFGSADSHVPSDVSARSSEVAVSLRSAARTSTGVSSRTSSAASSRAAQEELVAFQRSIRPGNRVTGVDTVEDLFISEDRSSTSSGKSRYPVDHVLEQRPRPGRRRVLDVQKNRSIYTVNVPGDGDCLYHAVIANLRALQQRKRIATGGGDQDQIIMSSSLFPGNDNTVARRGGGARAPARAPPPTPRSLRKAVRDWFATRLDEVSPHAHGATYRRDFQMELRLGADSTDKQILNELAKPGVFSGDNEIEALSHVLGLPIEVYAFARDLLQHEDGGGEAVQEPGDYEPIHRNFYSMQSFPNLQVGGGEAGREELELQQRGTSSCDQDRECIRLWHNGINHWKMVGIVGAHSD